DRAATFGASASLAIFATWADPDVTNEQARIRWGLWALSRSLVFASFYIGWLLALIGLWTRREVFRDQPGSWVLAMTALVLTIFLFKVAATMGYLSERHTILILLVGCLWAAAGLHVVGKALSRLFGGFWNAQKHEGWVKEYAWSLGLLL